MGSEPRHARAKIAGVHATSVGDVWVARLAAAAFDEECGKQGDDVICWGLGSPLHDVGITALSLLAFLGAGETNKSGKYRDTVKKALRWLTDVQDPTTGNFGNDQIGQHTYDHIIATLAMTEAYALTKQHFRPHSPQQQCTKQ